MPAWMHGATGSKPTSPAGLKVWGDWPTRGAKDIGIWCGVGAAKGGTYFLDTGDLR